VTLTSVVDEEKIGMDRIVCWMWASVATGLLAFGCGGSDGSNTAGGTDVTVVGTITLPADATGTCAMVAVDDDTTGANSSARRTDGSYLLSYELVSSTTLTFAFDQVPTGNYYVWGFVDTDGSSSDPNGDCEMMGGPASGDHFGYYPTGLLEPSAPNVTVPHADGLTYEFTLGVFP
jgi:hypothetical protein